MKQIKVTIRNSKGAEVTVVSEAPGLAMKVIINYEEVKDLIDKLVTARDWMEKKQKHSDYKYPQLTEESNGD